MDLIGSLVDTKLKIYPSDNFVKFIKSITITNDTPENIVELSDGQKHKQKKDLEKKDSKSLELYLSALEIEKINEISKYLENSKNLPNLRSEKSTEEPIESSDAQENTQKYEPKKEEKDDKDKKTKNKSDLNHEEKCDESKKPDEKSLPKKESQDRKFLTTSDIDWLYAYINKQKEDGNKDIPYLHTLLEDSTIETPENEKIKRNPELEARCVKLRSQQEAREYRKMTRGVDNVRMRYPEDTIAYQLKSINRQLIAIGQFIISIFAGFLFGFRGIELMIGYLDFGFRLLLGVMCALVIALAEIYFLAKKLNEELQFTETIQLGGPPKFENSETFRSVPLPLDKEEKEHQD